MRKLLLILLFATLFSFAQEIELGVSGSAGKFLSVELGYLKNQNGFYVSYGSRLDGPKGKHVTTVLKNYGQEIRGFGIQKQTIDLKYSRAIAANLAIRVSGTWGRKFAYAEYYDDRFKGGGYYTTDNSENEFGGGGDLIYSLSNHFGVMASYNSIRKGEGGLFVKF